MVCNIKSRYASVTLFSKVQSCAPCRVPSRVTWLEHVPATSEKAANTNGHLGAPFLEVNHAQFARRMLECTGICTLTI